MRSCVDQVGVEMGESTHGGNCSSVANLACLQSPEVTDAGDGDQG